MTEVDTSSQLHPGQQNLIVRPVASLGQRQGFAALKTITSTVKPDAADSQLCLVLWRLCVGDLRVCRVW